MTSTNQPGWPSFSQEEADRVRDVLLSNKVNYWTGTEGRQFESEFAQFAGTEHAVAIANGTVALEAAWRVLGIGCGDEVIVPSRSFIASVSSLMIWGGKPVFADVDADSQTITAETIAPLLNSKTKAILCVHLAGWPCDMDAIAHLASARNIAVVEDCAQAHGARFRGKPVGSLSTIGTWSFCQDKIMTLGGEGGMITTNDKDLWSRIWSFKDHGKSYDVVHAPHSGHGFRWLHEAIGTNGRLTEMQSAIGRIQLKRMPQWHDQRKRNAEAIQAVCRDCPGLRVPDIPGHIEHGWYKCYVFLEEKAIKGSWSRDRIITEIDARGVPCFSGSCPEIYRERAFDGLGIRPLKRLPVARMLGETSLMFEVHPTLTPADIDKTCSAIREVMALAVK